MIPLPPGPLRLALRLLGLALALAPAAARADTFYGVTFFDNQLIAVDSATGAGTLIADLGGDLGAYGLANVGGRLLAFDSAADVLRRIDPTTGAIVETIDLGFGDLLGEGDLAIRADGVGVLSSALDPSTFEERNDFFRFDLNSGTLERVGSTPVAFDGLAFDRDGTLYGLGQLDDRLYTIDPDTGDTLLVGSLGVGAGSPFGALAFGLDGTLYAMLDDRLFVVDKATGAATAVDPDPLSFVGFSSVSGLAVVPEPSSFLLLGLGGAGLWAARRRRR